MTFEGTIGIAIGIIAIVAPEWVPKMKESVRNTITTGGFLVLGYSGILLLQETTGMKLQSGPLATIIGGTLIVLMGVYWHIHLSKAQSPKATTAPTGPAVSGVGRSTFENVNIEGGWGTGIKIDGSRDNKLKNVKIHGAREGIDMKNTRDNEFENIDIKLSKENKKSENKP